MFAPIIIFAFNRLQPLKACLKALQANTESKDSDLIVFVDGPRSHKSGEAEKVEAVRDFVKTIKGFKSLTYHFSERNKGLGPSIISGVTDVINQYGRTIVVEDDLIVSRNFLYFMNQGLSLYESSEKIISVCGWGCRIQVPGGYQYDAYCDVRSASWSWATWKDRWRSIDWELKDWDRVVKNRWAFNRWGGSDCYGMLKDWHDGKNKSWAIRFTYSQFQQNKLSVFPVVSKVDNEGFGTDATNCPKYSRTKWDFDETENKLFRFPEQLVIDNRIHKQVMRYRSLKVRIKAKVINTFLNLIYHFK